MTWSIEELVIVLFIQWPLLKLAKPVALIFMSLPDFDRRRRAWIALTIAAFVSPNFWILVALAIPILYVTGRKDSNPAAVYLLLMNAIPPLTQTITAAGVTVFNLDMFMLLALCVMTPAALRIWRAPQRRRYASLRWIDLALLGYGILNSFQYIQAEAADGTLYPITVTDSIRRALVFIVIAFIPYFVTSRSNVERRSLVDSVAAYCLGCCLLSGVAIFESLRGWLLFGEMPSRLGATNLTAQYLIRGHSLRAMASSGHPLTLATMLSIGVVLWLFLRAQIPSSRARGAITLLLVGGLFVTYSRGPWLGAVLGGLAFIALGPRAVSNLLKTALGVAVAGALLAATPFGQKIIDLLPFFGGKVDLGTFTYRQLLLDRCTELISLHPFIGDSAVLLKMEDLRQGEGIIDVVNVYLEVLLNDGLIGLTLLLGFALLALVKANSLRRRIKETDADRALLGAALIGSMAGLFVTLAGGALGNSERIYYMLGALIAAYVASGEVRAAISHARPAAMVAQYRR